MKPSASGPLAYFGGTFDPIHYGHLRTAVELAEVLHFDHIYFLPSGQPPHRESTFASNELRMAMVQAAIIDEPRFSMDDRECLRTKPSYTVDTLLELRAEYPTRSICLLIGMDAFLSMPSWYRASEILQLAHLVVAHRPGWQAPTHGDIRDWLLRHSTLRSQDLHEKMAGCIYVHEVTQLEISSSAVRTLVKDGRDPVYLLPPRVRDILMKNRCYTK